MRPTEIKVHKKSATLELVYPNQTFLLRAEYLRVFSPSAEVQGHAPGQQILQHGKKTHYLQRHSYTGALRHKNQLF